VQGEAEEKRWGLPNARSNRIAGERGKQASERESEAQEHVCLPCCPQRLLLRHIISPAMMDLDPPSPSTPQSPHHNAVAGPSSIPLDSSLFLLPPGPYQFLFNLNHLSISPLFHQAPLALPSFSRAHKTSSLDSISCLPMTSLSAPSSLKNTIPTLPNYRQRPPFRPPPTRERARNATPAPPPLHPLQRRARTMIRTTMRGEMEKKRKIHTDTSSRVFQANIP